ncbi:hypothetical protein O9G_004352 [Rozella allomycis CSF55]|uniref:Uncharacterized protein n=1 Tax=Rozella allomycis (strain CSF55) TaxID=988480 RepID=A0A075AXM8_ROZAC|nr:hypothetical protein O9G_004352 [Rozella allomycis CSF55]|eukprot:EPZ35002.1 hypothetical protein O9G_004352 [Rozella allomycis CSF55]
MCVMSFRFMTIMILASISQLLPIPPLLSVHTQREVFLGNKPATPIPNASEAVDRNTHQHLRFRMEMPMKMIAVTAEYTNKPQGFAKQENDVKNAIADDLILKKKLEQYSLEELKLLNPVVEQLVKNSKDGREAMKWLEKYDDIQKQRLRLENEMMHKSKPNLLPRSLMYGSGGAVVGAAAATSIDQLLDDKNFYI